VTDDTTMSLALGDDALVSSIGDAYVRWLKGKPVDCGNTCRRGIQRYMREGTLEGPFNPGDGGNGAAMRNLPAVFATLGDDAAFEKL
jgi:ADP-ribosyl-[dinitrogen reductase] hydrolase